MTKSTKVWDPAIQCYIDDGRCHCSCHYIPGIVHCFPCCEPEAEKQPPTFDTNRDPGDESDSK
jgi:hypothetical protein